MDQSKIDMFLATNGKNFSPAQLQQVKELLTQADESRYQLALSLEFKEPTTMLIVSLLGGSLGIDRFMLGETGLGVAKLLTAGGCGIWTIIDWFSIQDRTKEYNFNLLMQAIA